MIYNKKAQSGPGLGTMVTLGVALIAAVLIVLFLSGFFGNLRGQVDTLPSALATKAEICKSVSSNSVSFCEFTKIDIEGVKGDSYVNCKYDGNTAFEDEVAEAGSSIICDAEDKTELFDSFCSNLGAAANDAHVNGKDCPSYVPVDK